MDSIYFSKRESHTLYWWNPVLKIKQEEKLRNKEKQVKKKIFTQHTRCGVVMCVILFRLSSSSGKMANIQVVLFSVPELLNRDLKNEATSNNVWLKSFVLLCILMKGGIALIWTGRWTVWWKDRQMDDLIWSLALYLLLNTTWRAVNAAESQRFHKHQCSQWCSTLNSFLSSQIFPC